MLGSKFGYGSLLDPRGNLIILCSSYDSFLLMIDYDYTIAASNFIRLFLNRHVV